MKIRLLAVLAMLTFAFPAMAQDDGGVAAPPPLPTAPPPLPTTTPYVAPVAPSYSANVLGIYGGIGVANTLVTEGDQPDPLLAGIGEIHYNHFFSRKMGFDFGIGIARKGFKIPADGYYSSDDISYKFLVLEIPIGTVFNFRNFRLGFSFVPNIALKGKVKLGSEDVDVPDSFWDDFWDNFGRVDLASRLTIGGRIPFTPNHAMTITGMFEMDLINRYKGEGSDTSMALCINAFVMLGYEFGS